MNLFGNNPSGCMHSKSSKLLEKIRECIPYFNRRLDVIERQGNAKILSDEIDMIDSWLDIARDVNADTTMDYETLDVNVDSIMEMMRLHPIPEAFSTHPAKKDLEESEKVETVSSPNKEGTGKEGVSNDETVRDCLMDGWNGDNGDTDIDSMLRGGLNFGDQVPATPKGRGRGYVVPTNQDFSSLTPVDPIGSVSSHTDSNFHIAQQPYPVQANWGPQLRPQANHTMYQHSGMMEMRPPIYPNYFPVQGPPFTHYPGFMANVPPQFSPQFPFDSQMGGFVPRQSFASMNQAPMQVPIQAPMTHQLPTPYQQNYQCSPSPLDDGISNHDHFGPQEFVRTDSRVQFGRPEPDINQIKEKARQHFTVRGRPRGGPSSRGHRYFNHDRVAPVMSNSTENPDLASNQIASTAPTNKRPFKRGNKRPNLSCDNRLPSGGHDDNNNQRPEQLEGNDSSIGKLKKSLPSVIDPVKGTMPVTSKKTKANQNRLQEIRKKAQQQMYIRLGSGNIGEETTEAPDQIMQGNKRPNSLSSSAKPDQTNKNQKRKAPALNGTAKKRGRPSLSKAKAVRSVKIVRAGPALNGTATKRGRPRLNRAKAIRSAPVRRIVSSSSDDDHEDANFESNCSVEVEGRRKTRLSVAVGKSAKTDSDSESDDASSQVPVHLPDILINPNLNKVKIEQDYNPIVEIKKERVEEGATGDIDPMDFVSVNMGE